MAAKTANLQQSSGKELSKLIGQIGRDHVKLRDNIQIVCLKCIKHAVLYGDVVFGTRLMEATNGAVRRQGIVNYLSEFGPFTWQEKEKKFTKNTRWARTTVEKVDEWIETVKTDKRGPWYEFSKEGTIKPYDFLKDVNSLLNRVENHIKNGENVGYGELRDSISIAVETYKEKQKKMSDAELKKLEEEQKKDLEKAPEPNEQQEQMAATQDRELRAA